MEAGHPSSLNWLLSVGRLTVLLCHVMVLVRHVIKSSVSLLYVYSIACLVPRGWSLLLFWANFCDFKMFGWCPRRAMDSTREGCKLCIRPTRLCVGQRGSGCPPPLVFSLSLSQFTHGLRAVFSPLSRSVLWVYRR